ncbi:MAG: hypothetical protein ACP5EP_06900 [Acidobacteriaceae bacterium]
MADELFIAVALLQREDPGRPAFSVKEVLERAEREKLTDKQRPGLAIHAYKHAVANVKPDPGKYRMLYRTADGKVRLLRAGDDVYPGRTGKIWPDPEEVPPKYRELIAWAQRQYGKEKPSPSRWLEGVLQMRGMGKKLWAGEDADAYVRKLREDWR